MRAAALALLLGAAAQAEEIAITAKPVEIVADDLSGLRLTGAWALTSDHSAFGGLSGLALGDDLFLAVGDRGHVFQIPMPGSGETRGQSVPLTDAAGRALETDDADAEGLTRVGNRLLISLERNDRIAEYREGRLIPLAAPAAFADLPFNDGLEGLATLPNGGLLALAEDEGGKARYWIIAPGGAITPGVLPLTSRHRITGADLAPDGRLYLVLRDFSRLTGVSIRVMRYTMDGGHPVAESAEVLASFEHASGIDNMEGIALSAEGDALWLVSDDNFNAVQRTLLMRFRVE